MSEAENPAAFPCTGEGFSNPNYSQHGMTLRDWIAGKAATAIIGSPDRVAGMYQALGRGEVGSFEGAIARSAYALADAMLAERAK